MFKSLLITAVLLGYISNEIGRIGIRYDPVFHTVAHVCKDSNAFKAGLKQGDKIIFYTGNDIKGQVGTSVFLIIKRKNQILFFYIERESCTDVSSEYVE